MIKRLSAIIILSFCLVQAYAEISSVGATLNPMDIRIGEQVNLHYEYKQLKGDIVTAPIFTDTIIKGVEIVENVKRDTIDLKDGRIQVNMNYLVTSFDSGYYYIPPMPFACEGDTVLSSALGISVNTVEVNPEMDDVKDIKPIMDAPFSWEEFFKWVGIVVGILAVLALIAFILVKYVFKTKVPFLETKEEPKLPPHVVALQRLEEIKEQKPWQNGRVKEFYTEVTDVLREYLDGRFGINAKELTSDEIMQLIKKNPETEEVKTILKQLLELSDLVKFAKLVPLEDENARIILDAFTIVDKTKVEEKPADSEETENSEAASKEDVAEKEKEE